MYSVCESYPLFAYVRNNAKLCHATVCHELKNLSGMHSGHSITRPSYEHNNPTSSSAQRGKNTSEAPSEPIGPSRFHPAAVNTIPSTGRTSGCR